MQCARYNQPWDHVIELKPGASMKNCSIYRLTPKESLALKEYIEEHKRKGYIRPSKSPMASPFFFVDKKDGKLCPVQDYCALNNITIKNAAPLPLIPELINKLGSAWYFTKLDIHWGYNNIHIKEGDEYKAAFKTPLGLFEPTVMTFGLCNAPATFQTFMNNIFEDMIDKGHVVVYLDDILIFAEDTATLDKLTHDVLSRLEKHDLFLKPEKCVFTDPPETLLCPCGTPLRTPQHLVLECHRFFQHRLNSGIYSFHHTLCYPQLYTSVKDAHRLLAFLQSSHAAFRPDTGPPIPPPPEPD
jgi:hypothetical protein